MLYGNKTRDKLRLIERLELENHQKMTSEILSKRSLQLILKLEEMQWSSSEAIQQQNEKISEQISQLIDLKTEFNKIHVPRVVKEYKEILRLGTKL